MKEKGRIRIGPFIRFDTSKSISSTSQVRAAESIYDPILETLACRGAPNGLYVSKIELLLPFEAFYGEEAE